MTTKPAPSLKAASEDKADGSISKSTPTFLVDPRSIVVEPGFNARPIDPDHVAYLKSLMVAGVDVGFLTLQMINGKATLRDGEHRWTGYMQLIAEGVDIQKVKAIEFKGDEKAAIFLMLATQSGKRYEPMQVGEQYVKLINLYGMSYAEIAAQRGMSVQHVKDSIRLTEQPAELKDMINTGEIKAATALKLVKKEGATAAVETVKEARLLAPKKGITQKVIDNVAKNVVSEASKRAAAARDHISAMVDSPSLDGPTKAHLRDTLSVLVGGRMKSPDVAGWLAQQRVHDQASVREAAALLTDVLSKKAIPNDSSPGAQAYGHMVWLQDMASGHKVHFMRAAAHWFLAVLDVNRKGGELVQAPSVMTIGDALQAEMDSGGAVLAETLCPEQAALIAWVRGR